MKPRRILIFSLSYFPRFVGGAEVAVKEITDRIPASEASFDMITLGDRSSPKDEMLGNVRVHRVLRGNGWPQKLAFPFIAYLKALKLQREEAFDSIWSIMASYGGFAAFLLKRRYPRLPNVLTIQEGDNFARRNGIFHTPYTWIFKSADRVQAISKYLADWSRGMGAICPIEVVPNAVDLGIFSRAVDSDEKEQLEEKLCRKEGDIFLITTSRLVAKNAVDDIISALQYLPKNVKLLILGMGPLETELKCQCLRLGMNYTDEPPVNPGNRVHFLGYIPHKDMPPYLAISSVFVRPAISEGLGNSFLEAMAAGVPVVGTPVGGIPDFLIDCETGLFCEAKNPRSIAQKAEKYLKDAESHDYIVKKARAMVKDKYQWDKITRAMEKILLAR